MTISFKNIKSVIIVLLCTFAILFSCKSRDKETISSTAFGVGTWCGSNVSIWDSAWSYTYNITLYNDGTAEGTIIDHGPLGDTKRYGIGRWYRNNASFGDKKYYWTDIQITTGDLSHRFYVDAYGGVYAPFGRPVWQTIRDDKPVFTFQRCNNVNEY